MYKFFQDKMQNNLIDFKNWIILNGCATSTSIIYCYKLNIVLNNIQQLDEININQFLLAKREKGLSSESLNLYINAIRKYCKFMNVEIKIPKIFKLTEKIPKYITLEFLEKEILPVLSDLFPAKRILQIKTVLYFMFYSGLRKSEVENLERKNFNFKEKEIKVYIKKTNEERLIPLNNKMIKILLEYFNSEIEEGNAFNLFYTSIKNIFQTINNNFKNKKIFPHMFRHSFAMHMQKNNFSTREIQYLLGHKNINSTLRYEHANINVIKEKFNKRIK